MAHTYVNYFIPYDGDAEEHPNVFLVRKPQKGLTLSDIQQVGGRAAAGYDLHQILAANAIEFCVCMCRVVGWGINSV